MAPRKSNAGSSSKAKKRTYRRKAPYARRYSSSTGYSRHNRALALLAGQRRHQVRLLTEPFYAADRGAKIPDADSSASIPVTVRHTHIITPANATASATAAAAALRIMPNCEYVALTSSGSAPSADEFQADVSGKVTASAWGSSSTFKTVTQWQSFRSNFSRVRTVNYGARFTYIGNSDLNSGYITYMLSAGDHTAEPDTSDASVSYRRQERYAEAKADEVRPRRLSSEFEYDDQTAFDTGASLNGKWEHITCFVEGAALTSTQPLLVEMVWNLECLPGSGTLGALAASEPARQQPSLIKAASDITRNAEPVIKQAQQAVQHVSSLVSGFQSNPFFGGAGLARPLKRPRMM